MENDLTAVRRGHEMFYLPRPELADGLVFFPQTESLHMTGSLRLRAGDVVAATDGKGKVYEVRIESTDGREVAASILGFRVVPAPLPRMTLFMALVRPARTEVALEKCTELGLSAFVPVVSQRSLKAMGAGRAERLARIATEAMKQSLGAHMPDISPPVPFAQALEARAGGSLLLVASEEASIPCLRDLGCIDPARPCEVWVGPEGGFADSEKDALARAGATAFSLGPRRLRSETAAIAALAIIHCTRAT